MSAIKCEKRIYDNSISRHSHKYAQLVMPIHGTMHIKTKFKDLTLNNDKIFFIPQDCMHDFTVNSNNEFLVLDINNSITTKSDILKMQGGVEINFDEKWKALQFLLMSECKNNTTSSSIDNLFLYCYDLLKNNNVPESIQYLNEHFSENIDINMLAQIEHYSNTYYSEWFKNLTNTTPKEYIQKLRIEKAKELLIHTDYTILQIAQIVGYNHNSSFTRLFKEYEKLTPLQFKIKNLK